MKSITCIWRYSHFILAVSSFVFITIASITGIILTTEPILNKTKSQSISNLHTITLQSVINKLKNEYEEVLTVKVNEHNFVEAAVITKNGDNDTFYINPETAKKIAKLKNRPTLYKWTTSLHRSLFLKSTGRFLVTFFTFLLLLITISGIVLISKRQGGIRNFFSKTVKENTHQYFHVISGKYTLIPLLVITLTGIFLSLEKFEVLPKKNNNHIIQTTSDTKKSALNEITLNQVKNIEFPFSSDEEDYFIIQLHNAEIFANQYTGAIISKKNISWIEKTSHLSLNLHTGNSSLIWAFILLISSFSLLYFIFSGFSIYFNRKKHQLIKNNCSKQRAEIIILVGSESGSTYSFANSLIKGLRKADKKVFVDVLNNYTHYPNAKELIILTATYGDGEAPSNAKEFLSKIPKTNNKNVINFTVVGFGSYAYQHFCKFAFDIHEALNNNPNFNNIIPLKTINNQSFNDFKDWGLDLSNYFNTNIPIVQEHKKTQKQSLFTVKDKTELNTDDTFLLTLSTKKSFESGDLLEITPKQDSIPRYYSIGKVNNLAVISIKKHEYGICSNFLNSLEIETTFKARIKKNPEFHLPKKNKEALFIANGTGIGPFLGMINSAQANKYLFWGARTSTSSKIYMPIINRALQEKTLNGFFTAYSREGNKMYVQDILIKEKELVSSILKNQGAIFICGSIQMMNAVLITLEQISKENLQQPLNKNLIKTDCY